MKDTLLTNPEKWGTFPKWAENSALQIDDFFCITG
jgi:hypothetical protein